MSIQYKILTLVNFSIFSSGIKSILEKEEFHVIGEASHWDGLFELLERMTPDIILLDFLYFTDSTVKLLQKLRNDYAEIPVLLFINQDSSDFLRDFIVMGIMGFVFSNTTLPELITAIDRVANGREYFPDGISKLLKEALQCNHGDLQMFRHIELLTLRELAVCDLICNGLTYKEIGTELYISPRTVETHKRNIFAKLKIKSTAELIKYRIQNRLN